MPSKGPGQSGGSEVGVRDGAFLERNDLAGEAVGLVLRVPDVDGQHIRRRQHACPLAGVGDAVLLALVAVVMLGFTAAEVGDVTTGKCIPRPENLLSGRRELLCAGPVRASRMIRSSSSGTDTVATAAS